jgi:hypothetical protein
MPGLSRKGGVPSLLFLLLMVVLILVMYAILMVTLDRKIRMSIQKRLDDPDYMRRWAFVQEEVCPVKKAVPADTVE